MTDWACGLLRLTGTRKGVLAFTSRFQRRKNKGHPQTRRFAAGCFPVSRAAVRASVEDCFRGASEREERTYTQNIRFRWSAYSCLSEGEPRRHPGRYVSLAEACREDGVDAEIRTCVPGMCFEECLTGTRDGAGTAACELLPGYHCPRCGEIRYVPSFENKKEAVCIRCGLIGLEN